MTLSYRAAPVQAYNGRDQIYHFTFPWPTPAGDGGLGGGGADSITVKMGPDDYRLAWNSSVGSYPPAGYEYPAQPTLTGSEDWWIHGIHGYGRVTWSPNYGVVVSGVVGLRPNGTVGHVHASYLPDVTANFGNGDRRWKYMAPYYGSGGEGGSNSWNYHLGYDMGLRSDLVVIREERRVYRISGSWGSIATRGAALWTMTAAHVAAGYTLDCDLPASGFDRVHLPWRNEWWIVRVHDSDGDIPNTLIWGFNHTQSGDASAFEVDIHPDALSRIATGFPDNLCLSVDHMGQRVFAAQADILASPQSFGGALKYPLLLWEINPSTRAWTQITLASPLYVVPPGKARGHNPLCWHGGFRWIYWDHIDGLTTGLTAYWQTPSSGYTPGAFKPRLIYIPKTGAPRNITFTSNAAGTMPLTYWNAAGDAWTDQKHNEYCYRPANDRVYLHGGDVNGMGSGQQSIWSFDPENAPATLALEQSGIFSNREFRPANCDEHGWQIRSDEFWMMYGYPFPTDINAVRHPGWTPAANQNVSDWHDETGGTQVLWKWNPTTRVWTTHAVTAASGETGPFGLETSDPLQKFTSAHQKRWYYDSSADRMVIAAYGGSLLYQTPCVKFITFNEGSPKYRVFKANRLTSGATTLPDGRPVPNPLGYEDAAAFDSTTGYLYVFNNLTGDVFRVQTWTSVGNYAYPSYTDPQGHPQLPVEWCCKIHPTTDTGNVTKLAFMHGAVWIVNTYAANRARVFSWAPGDAHAWEHDTPYGMCCGAIAVYKKAGVDKLVAIGGAAVSTQRNGPPYKRIWTGAVT